MICANAAVVQLARGRGQQLPAAMLLKSGKMQNSNIILCRTKLHSKCKKKLDIILRYYYYYFKLKFQISIEATSTTHA